MLLNNAPSIGSKPWKNEKLIAITMPLDQDIDFCRLHVMDTARESIERANPNNNADIIKLII